jgi:hypothetical protein
MVSESSTQPITTRKGAALIVIVAFTSLICLWPVILEPTLDLPWWISIAIVALTSALATVLCAGRWFLFAALSATCTLVGSLACSWIWPLQDGISQSYAGLVALVAAAVILVASLAASALALLIPALNKKQLRAAWISLLCVASVSPVALALRPSIVARRVARNESLTFKRVSALKDSIDRVQAEGNQPSRACDGNVLKQHYTGPPFTHQDWQYVTGNFVTEDGYAIGITINCAQPRKYIVTAMPKRGISDGTHGFCADRSFTRNCAPQYDTRGDGEVCLPCPT